VPKSASYAPKTAIVGIGETEFYRRGKSLPLTYTQMAGRAIKAACADAGLSVKDIDGFSYYSMSSSGNLETAALMETLGMPEIGFSATVTSGGGGCAGAVGLASLAIHSGAANYVVTVLALQQSPQNRLGQGYKKSPGEHPEAAFIQTSGLNAPGPMMSVLARRHMFKYGTRREALAEIAMTERANARTMPGSLMTAPMTLEDYFNSPIIADPLCRNDFCLETDGAVAVITASQERAKDLKQTPVNIASAEMGGLRDWGRAFGWNNMPDELFASSGHRSIAKKLFAKGGLVPADVDVALLYDHFSHMVLFQLEDYGFCEIGEGGPFVESGAIRIGGKIPVNPMGGQLSHAYMAGMTQITEGVRQLRGTAANQIPKAEVALVTGGPASLPVSALLLSR
jgi:acetyl-CoA acetyltransferase